MITHNLKQGTPEWHAYRAEHFNASDAPAMMGCSPYKTRSQLMHELHTGLTAEVDAGTQRLYNDGHRFEGLSRPLAEEIIGEDLYPVTGSLDNLSASFDGLTMDETIDWEHKTLNEQLRSVMVDGCTGKDLPLMYRVQMEQQLLVSGAEKCLFMASKWNGDQLVEERHCWYFPDLELRQQILDGWLQFEADLAAYVPPAAAEVKPVGKTPETLPALRVEVTGMVTASNLAQYKEHALAVFAGINRDLQTEQDFADAEKIVKWCGDVESRLEAAKQHALSQTQSIDELFKAIDDIKAEARSTRLDLGKLVDKRKDEIRADIVNTARAAYTEHVAGLNGEIYPAVINCPAPDFSGAIKGKRSLDSMRDAVDVALANGKIAADAQAKAIRANFAAYKSDAEGYEFLFADLAALLHKAADDFNLVVKSRIDAHELAEAAKANAAAAVEAIVKPVLAEPTGPRMILTQRPAVPTKPTTPPSLKLGVIADRLGFVVTADFLSSLGFEAITERNAKLYYEADFHRICAAIVEHVQSICVTA